MAVRRVTEPFKAHMFDRAHAQDGLFGVDEVGRGCTAGPVVAAAVMLSSLKAPSIVKDSKKLTPQQRVQAYAWIAQHSHFCVGIIDNQTIDRINIARATEQAMRKAVYGLMQSAQVRPAYILIDAVGLDFGSDIQTLHFFKGEDLSVSIAAASIVAKVTRDHIMEYAHTLYPAYGFDAHKGYATKQHSDALEQHGLCPLHRHSFLKAFVCTP